MSKEQWVNLPKADDYVADSISSKERLGPARFKIKFKKELLSGFQVKITKQGDDFESYSKKEQGRNESFRIRGSASASNRGKKEVVLDTNVFLNAAGGNQYKIGALYKKKEVHSALVLESRRKLLYQVMSMAGIAAGSTASLEAAFWQPSKKYFIEMKKQGPVASIKHFPVLDGTNRSDFIRAAAKGYTLKKYKPYAFAVAFVEYIAKPEPVTIEKEVSFTLPGKTAKWNPANRVWNVSLDRYLWYELNLDDDRRRRWLRSCKLWFEPDGAPLNRVMVPVGGSDITPSGAARGPYGGRNQLKVRVNVKALPENLAGKKGKWKLELKLVCVKGFSAGVSLGGVNLVAIATKGWWRDSTASAAYVLNHEIGHKIGMVSDGQGRSPDTHGNLYGDKRGVNDRDHKGAHCAKGASWNPREKRGKRWSGTPACVMFGATGIGRNRAPEEFCDDCAKIVRKLDLSATTLLQRGFKKSLEEY